QLSICSPSCILLFSLPSFFFFTATAPTELYTLSLHDALPISPRERRLLAQIERATRQPLTSSTLGSNSEEFLMREPERPARRERSEEHTSELQSRFDLVCRLLLEKKKYIYVSPTSMRTFCLAR